MCVLDVSGLVYKSSRSGAMQNTGDDGHISAATSYNESAAWGATRVIFYLKYLYQSLSRQKQAVINVGASLGCCN